MCNRGCFLTIIAGLIIVSSPNPSAARDYTLVASDMPCSWISADGRKTSFTGCKWFLSKDEFHNRFSFGSNQVDIEGYVMGSSKFKLNGKPARRAKWKEECIEVISTGEAFCVDE